MKTRNLLKAIAMMATVWMVAFIPAISQGSMNMNSFVISYHADSIFVYTNEGNMKETFTYDDSEQLVSYLKQNEVNRGWVNSELDTFTYDENGNLLTDTFQQWSDPEWLNVTLYTYAYDENGNLLTMLEQYWEEVDWANSMLFTYTYDELGKKLSFINQYWEPDTWVNSDMSLYTYDDNGYLVIDLYHYWDGISWVEMARTLFTYDDSGRKLTQLEQYWDGGWFDAVLFTNTYDEFGNWISYVGQQWTGDEWWNMSAATMTYDMDGNCLSRIDQFWVGTDWQNTRKSEYEYQPGLIIGHGFIWEGEQWIAGDTYTMNVTLNNEGEPITFYTGNCHLVKVHYSGFGVGIAETGKEQSLMFSVYPNPAREQFTIIPQFGQSGKVCVTLVDISGKDARTLYDGFMQSVAQPIPVGTDQFNAGLYILEMRAGEKVARQKVSIVR